MAATTSAPSGRKTKRLEDSIGSRIPTGPVSTGRFAGLAQSVQKQPWVYAGAIAFILIMFVAGLVINLSRSESKRAADTALAQALDAEEPGIRAAALIDVSKNYDAIADEALAMAAESYYSAGSVAEAESAFSKVRSDFPQSTFFGQATEGLGYIAEDKGNYDEALAYYEEARQSTDGFIAKRQLYNIGRVKESKGDFTGAVAAFDEQQTAFPGSSSALNAGAAATRIRNAHPDLFPDDATTGTDAAIKLDETPLTLDGAATAEPAATDAVTEDTSEAPVAEEVTTESPDESSLPQE